MFENQMPADELAQVREKIHALRMREIKLRKCFTDACEDGFYEGNNFDVVVQLQKRCVLNQNRLPAEIRNDPQYFDVRYAPVVRLVPRAEPRLPLDYSQSAMLVQNDSFDVLERHP